ncbi:MAG: methyl-accepting chemotaxis protein, partial [Desulfofustis sp.]|nr:methyl-accepting chemotaxis protein [Desulfofustis sp.]
MNGNGIRRGSGGTMSIRGKILVTTIPFFVLLGLVTMFLSVRSLQVQGDHSLATIEEVMTGEKNEKLQDLVRNTFEILADRYRAAHDPQQVAAVYESELQSVVNLAYSAIEAIYQDGSLIDEEKKQRALQVVKSMRYAGTNYLWINDLQPAMVMHPINSALDGQDLSDYQDPQGKKLFIEMADLCRRDGHGYVFYLWPKPGEQEPVAKLSYVKLFEPWDWVIGTGVYLELAEQRFQLEAKEQIGKLRFGADNDDYFFILDTDAKMVMHPINPALDGEDLNNHQDPDGTFLFREMVSVARQQGEGFVSYRWPKPGEQEPVPKQSFVKLFEEWGWIVGTGIYVDDINKAMSAQQQDVSAAVNRQRSWIMAASVLMIAVVSLVMFFVAATISRPIRTAAEMLKDIAEGEGDLTRRLLVTTKDELADMARWFNTFVEKLQNIIAVIARDAKEIRGSAGQLSEISASMAEAAGSTSAKSETVAAAVEEMSAN